MEMGFCKTTQPLSSVLDKTRHFKKMKILLSLGPNFTTIRKTQTDSELRLQAALGICNNRFKLHLPCAVEKAASKR